MLTGGQLARRRLSLVEREQLTQASATALHAFQAAIDEAMAADLALEQAIRADLDEDSSGAMSGRSISPDFPRSTQIFTKLNPAAASLNTPGVSSDHGDTPNS